jgi:hypothetical protein
MHPTPTAASMEALVARDESAMKVLNAPAGAT